MDAVTQVPAPVNEPVLDYAPGSPERAELQVALAELAGTPKDLPHVIGGKRVAGTGKKITVRAPHAHKQVLGTMHEASASEAEELWVNFNSAKGCRASPFPIRTRTAATPTPG